MPLCPDPMGRGLAAGQLSVDVPVGKTHCFARCGGPGHSGEKLSADLKASTNMAHRAGYEVMIKKRKLQDKPIEALYS